MIMYQALYRKYRPKSFNDITGQEVIIQTLKNSIMNNMINHAYLFTGPRGTGKTSIAKILAKTVNCDHLDGVQTCDKCVNCTQYDNKQSIDVIEIDAATNNGIDEIRELRNKASLVPSTGKYKVYIVDEVHMLTQVAWNGLLKTLEEPPKHVIFVLATTEPYKIPATILSRCQRFDFKKIPCNKIVERLKYITEQENIEIDDQALYEIGKLSDGGMRDAISMLDQVIAYSNNKITVNDVHEVNGTITTEELGKFVKSLLEKDLLQLLTKLDEYNDNGKNLKLFSEEIVTFLKNVLLCKTVPGYFLGNEVDIENYKSFTEIVQVEELVKMINMFNSLINDVKYVNDPKINVEMLLIQLVNTEEKKEAQVVEVKEVKEEPKVKKEIKEVKEEVKEIKKEPIIKKDEVFESFKEIRINNTLAKLDKKIMKSLKELLDNSREYVLNAEYGNYMSLVLDGSIKAASDEYIIFMYDNDRMTSFFNSNITKIEELFSILIKEKYRVIAVSKDEWNVIKNEFNSKTKTYEYVEEKENKEVLVKVEKDEMQEFFGDLVEYN